MPRNTRGETDFTENQNTGTFLPASATQTDSRGRKYILLDDGSKFFTLPQDAGSARDSGGSFHKPANWNPRTGEWEPGGVDWQSVGLWLSAAAIGGYAASAYEPVAATVSAGTGAGAAGAGTAAGTSAGVGIGESGAVTGLAGSGFGSAGTGVATGAGVGGAAAGTGAATGGGTAEGVGSTAWAGLPDGVAGSGGIVGGTSAANVGGGLASSGGLGSLGWATLAGNVGSQAVGAYLNYKANSASTAAEAEANKAALDFAKQVYEQERQDSAPYRQLGASSVNTLAQIMGQPATSVPPKDLPMQTDPNHIVPGQPFPASMVPGSPSNAALVPMIGPDGSRKSVPPDQVAHWISLKARVDDSAAPQNAMMQPQQGRTISDVMARGA